MLGVAFVLYLMVIRPLLSRITQTVNALLPKPAPSLALPAEQETSHVEDENEEFISVEHIDGRMKSSSLKKIGEIVEKHPDETVSIIRNWMYS